MSDAPNADLTQFDIDADFDEHRPVPHTEVVTLGQAYR